MDCEETHVDLRARTPEDAANAKRQLEFTFKLSQTMPMTDEYNGLLRDYFGDNLGEGSYVAAPINGAALEKLKIGKRCFINANLLAMARGGITIDDDVQIAGNVSLVSNNHDLYDRMILTCKPVHIKSGAWLGANATVLPGVEIGKHAVVGAGSVVTKDVPDYAVVAGNPAHIIRMLDPKKFTE